ncbi:50S ribosomal protein L35 [Deferrisoma camini]|uniref:50S ribosomal protein L35 n=1 Tax=Deferrisoma camini TaxID=1035120 RepID=UPI00046CF434|nr:50S ribosomal protein L35 [Deferrisoma camini]NOY45014.1 50S ribosomal protein L35 [Deltaproteobacteria bacterium]
MPKMKTHRAAAKRFKKTASGKFKYRRAFRSHLLGGKKAKRKRQLRRPDFVDASHARHMQKLLPYA